MPYPLSSGDHKQLKGQRHRKFILGEKMAYKVHAIDYIPTGKSIIVFQGSCYNLTEKMLLNQPRFDMVVKQELGEDDKLLSQELVGEINGGTHYAHSMSANRIGHVPCVHSVQVLPIVSIGCPLYENLISPRQRKLYKF